MSSKDLRGVRRTLLKRLAAEFKVPFSKVRGTYSGLSDKKREEIIDCCLYDFWLEIPESCSVYENLKELRFLANYIHNERIEEYQCTTPQLAMV